MATQPARRIPLPEPPLADELVSLRPWSSERADDADALAAAWADPDIQRFTGVPAADRRSVDHARRWIAGERTRREAGLALDLVVTATVCRGARPTRTDLSSDPEGRLLGEVGLGPIDWPSQRAAIGWWIAPDERGRGLATHAVRLVARWAERELGLRLVASIPADNAASLAVARRAGVEVAIADSG